MTVVYFMSDEQGEGRKDIDWYRTIDFLSRPKKVEIFSSWFMNGWLVKEDVMEHCAECLPSVVEYRIDRQRKIEIVENL
jgi:hypothetical protein